MSRTNKKIISEILPSLFNNKNTVINNENNQRLSRACIVHLVIKKNTCSE
jgi:hypothetical protein